MIKRNLFWVISFLLIIDIVYSFIQHYHKPLDGDMAAFIIPNQEIQKIFNDPFALDIITKNKVYTDPNRFFSHWFISFYFKKAPIVFQKFVNPIDSIYLSCALIKTTVQVLLIYYLASLICGVKYFNKQILLASLLVTPLFQTSGYFDYMGIIDKSVSYFFFYSLPFCLLVIFFRPFYFVLCKKEKITFLTKAFLIILAVILPFSGPLITGIILIVCTLLISGIGWVEPRQVDHFSYCEKILASIKSIPKFFLFIIILVSFLSLYSLYIGLNNSVNIDNSMPNFQRYLKLPNGLINIFSQKIGMPLLLGLVVLNSLIIKKKYNFSKGKKILILLKWITSFSIMYILLLPLGGYRFYRPGIVRFDTFMPVTFCLIFYFGISTYFLLNNLVPKFQTAYLILIFVFLLIFTLSDKPDFKNYYCERNALEEISHSAQKNILLSSDCTIMSWRKIIDPKDSDLNGNLLLYWRVTKEKKLYYQY